MLDSSALLFFSHSCELTGGSTLTSKFDGKTCTGNADRGLAGYCQSGDPHLQALSIGRRVVRGEPGVRSARRGATTAPVLCQAFQAEGEPCGMDAVTTANPYCKAGADSDLRSTHTPPRERV